MTFKLGNQAKTWGSAALFFLVTTVLCGVIYTAACTGLAQLFFPHQANGSIIEVVRNEVTEASWWASGSPTRSTFGAAP